MNTNQKNQFLKNIEKFFNRHGSQSFLRLTMYGMIGTFLMDFMLSALRIPFSLFSVMHFNPYLIGRGEIWRAFTFPFLKSAGTDIMSLIWFGFSMLIYNIVITTMESQVGKARANLFGVFSWLVLLGYGMISGSYVDFTPVILAITALAGIYNPNFTIYFYFFIPVKGIVLGILGLGLMVYYGLILGDYQYLLILGLVLLLNRELISGYFSGKQRKKEFVRKTIAVSAEKKARHHCEVCGRTEKDVPDMVFRYCSKCEGSFEYCEDHIQNHEHRSNVVSLDSKREKSGIN